MRFLVVVIVIRGDDRIECFCTSNGAEKLYDRSELLDVELIIMQWIQYQRHK